MSWNDGSVAVVDNPIDLMLEYKRTKDIDIRNQLVMHYSYIARHIAIQTRGISAKYAQVEDMINQGILALIDCIEKFDPEVGAKFESYAYIRVHGAMLDFVRKQDWIPRRVRKSASDIAEAYTVLSNRYMREPTSAEIAEHLNVTVDFINKAYREISSAVTVSFEELIQESVALDIREQETDENDIDQIYAQELREVLVAAIDGLTERERLVLSLYYKEGLKFAGISKVLGVSEPRVCQIHAKAILKLRPTLERYVKG